MKSTALAFFLVLFLPSAALAQGQAFGIGGRLSLVRGDVKADLDSVRFLGGHIRARLSPRTALEVSMDVRTETDEALTRRVRDTPLQASLLLFPVRSVFAPYVLGGGGWYSHRVETLADKKTVSAETTRDFGWHAGFGAELKLGAHAAAHADYRYTFLRFGDDDDDIREEGFSRFLPSYEGSMWTAGLTVYF